MKLIIAIIRDSDSETVSQALLNSGFRVTRVASTGGFMRKGSTTLMIGVEDQRVDEAMELVKSNLIPEAETNDRCATLFVLNVQHYSQL
jgi:uncharacterized protein YaaQ